MTAAVFAACVLAGALTAAAAASTGDLAQKPGRAGCVSSRTGSQPCAEARAIRGAASVTVSPDGRSAYVTGSNSNALGVFDRAVDGTLTQKPGTAGCISDAGAGGCATGSALRVAGTVAVSPDGASAYVTSNAANAVAVFDRAPDGTLTQKPGAAACISDSAAAPCGDGTALAGAVSVTVSPDGRSVYVVSQSSDAVAVFDRAADGALTQKPGAAGCIADRGAGRCAVGRALSGAYWGTVSSDGRSVYVASQSGAVAVFDRAPDGALTQKPGAAGCVSSTGAGQCADGSALEGAISVTVSPDGRSAYVASFASSAVAVFDRARDGTLTQKPGMAGCISDSGGGRCARGAALDVTAAVTVSPDGMTVYVASFDSDALAIFDRAADGTLLQTGCISNAGGGRCALAAALDGAGSVTVSPDGKSLYATAFRSEAVTVFDRGPIRAAPLLSALSLTPARVRGRRSSTISYAVSEPAAVRFRVQRERPGRRAGGRCVRPTATNRGRGRCVRDVPVAGSFTQRAAAGSNALRFRGYVRGRRLPSGRFRLQAVATDADGDRSGALGIRFTILR